MATPLGSLLESREVGTPKIGSRLLSAPEPPERHKNPSHIDAEHHTNPPAALPQTTPRDKIKLTLRMCAVTLLISEDNHTSLFPICGLNLNRAVGWQGCLGI